MNPFRFFRSRQSGGRRGSPPAVEAALRSKRARDHLARKRRRGRQREDGLPAPIGPDLVAAPERLGRDARLGLDSPPAAPEARPLARDPAPFQLEPGPHRRAARKPAPPPEPARRAPPRSTAPRTATRAPVVPTRPLPRLVVPACTALALALGFAAARPLFERLWLPHAPLARVAVVGASVREPEAIAQALLARAGAPLDRLRPEHVHALVTADPWLESAESLRLPTGTLLVRVVERRAIARHQGDPDDEVALVDPEGRRFLGSVDVAGALPLVAGPVPDDASISATALEILGELRQHADLARDLAALTLYLPDSAGEAAAGGARGAESGYVLELGRQGPRVLLGQTFLKRRIARLATLVAQRDALLAGARVIDLRYADRAVLRTEPTSG